MAQMVGDTTVLELGKMTVENLLIPRLPEGIEIHMLVYLRG